jgi:hypothetical protein
LGKNYVSHPLTEGDGTFFEFATRDCLSGANLKHTILRITVGGWQKVKSRSRGKLKDFQEPAADRRSVLRHLEIRPSAADDPSTSILLETDR